MRILFVNEVERAAVSSENGSSVYAAESIYHPFLRKKFKSESDSDILTIDFDAVTNLNCFFMGFHNVTSGSVSFLDGALAPVGTPIDLEDAADIFVAYFSTIGVKRIVVEIDTDDDQVFVGGIGSGVYVQMPVDSGIVSNFPLSVDDATNLAQSSGGQMSRNKARSLRTRPWTWPNLPQDERDRVDPMVLSLGIGKPVYVDIFEGARDVDPPMYAGVIAPRTMSYRSVGVYDMGITFKEAQ